MLKEPIFSSSYLIKQWDFNKLLLNTPKWSISIECHFVLIEICFPGLLPLQPHLAINRRINIFVDRSWTLPEGVGIIGELIAPLTPETISLMHCVSAIALPCLSCHRRSSRQPLRHLQSHWTSANAISIIKIDLPLSLNGHTLQ